MQSLPMLNSILAFLVNVPTVGPYLVKILDLILAAGVMVTPVVAVWRAVVAAVQALATATKSAALASLATKLQTDDTKVEGFLNGYVLPILSDLSLISLPVAPAPAGTTPVQAKRK